MDSRPRRTDAGDRGIRGSALVRTVGFLMLLVGILMLRAVAAPLDGELRHLDALEKERDGLLAKADSLGRVLSTLASGDRMASRLLRDAEALGEASRDLDLEILLARDRCRSLAQQELASLHGVDSLGAVGRGDALKALLDGRLSQPPLGEFVLVEPDSSDGYETLLDKQAYLRDLRDRIAAIDKRSQERVERLSRERALLHASEGFAEESRFLDEGGRVGQGAIHMQQPGTPPDDGPGRPRPGGSLVGTSREDQPLTAAPSESTAIGGDIGVLEIARSRFRMDLARVDTLLQQTTVLLDRFVYPTH